MHRIISSILKLLGPPLLTESSTSGRTSTMINNTGFCQLEPAYTITMYVTGANSVGVLSNGSDFAHYELNAGSMNTVESFDGPKIEGQVVSGGDWLYIDSSREHARVNVKAMVKTTDGTTISVSWTGHCDLDDKIKAVFTGGPGASTTPFGRLIDQATIEAAHPDFAALEKSCFVGSGRFVLQDGNMAVETRISRVVAPDEM
ncbi:hypothetical protein OHC33_001063 [Knufia fluminis]|uniref:Uncharacterized protein n=1 Tax=Knufia fluminis TaxID=191047 RepID=A0AAN8I8T0_9EURO|nr:hypothetical protein OHC33_001063 [Knufia fluminis]